MLRVAAAVAEKQNINSINQNEPIEIDRNVSTSMQGKASKREKDTHQQRKQTVKKLRKVP